MARKHGWFIHVIAILVAAMAVAGLVFVLIASLSE